MLERGQKRAVPRDRGPAVVQDLHMRAAEIDHGFDGEEHAGLERHAFAGPAIMQDIRMVVEFTAETVAAEIAHHRAALAFGIALDRMADISRLAAGLHRS